MSGRLPTLYDYQEQFNLPQSVVTRAELVMENAKNIAPKAILCAASLLYTLEQLGYDAPTILDICDLSSIPNKRVSQVKNELEISMV